MAKLSIEFVQRLTDPKCTGLEAGDLPEAMAFREWHGLGKMLATLRGNMSWVWGDYLNFGERKYGHKYDQVEEDFGLEQGHAQNLCSVANRVPMRNRRSDLKWSHHRAVAKLDAPQQREWLAKAADSKWTVSELTDNLRDAGELPEQSKPEWASPGEARIAELEQILQDFATEVDDFLTSLDDDNTESIIECRAAIERRLTEWLPDGVNVNSAAGDT